MVLWMSTVDLEYLDAYMAICQLKASYCRTLDTKDWNAYTALFTEDYVLDVQGVEPIHGRDQAMAFVQNTLATTDTAHQVHTPEIEVNGDEAYGIWPLQDRNTWREPRN